jgi:hypothetical protein
MSWHCPHEQISICEACKTVALSGYSVLLYLTDEARERILNGGSGDGHLLIPVDANGDGPLAMDDPNIDDWVCLCGDPLCQGY